MQKVFTEIYERCMWGSNGSDFYNGSSGPGSDPEYNRRDYIPFLKNFIVERHIDSIVDLGCGDFRFGPLIYDGLDLNYIGYELYPRVVSYNSKKFSGKYEFRQLDFFSNAEQIEIADLCIIKDVLQHWNLRDIYSFMDFAIASKKFKYILICNCAEDSQNDTDIETGQCRPLSCDFFPIKKYNAKRLLQYGSKEVSLIDMVNISEKSPG